MTVEIPIVRGPLAPRENLIRIGTRGSELAVTQTSGVARTFAAQTGCDVALVIITTKGDTSPAPLAQLGGTGVFVSALRDALLAGQCDLAVHSLKDLPTGECPGITLGAIPERADARDALCARDGLTLAELPRGARVGTGSPRRSAQVLRQRPDLDVRGIRGNVDSRLARITDDLDAVVLAAAGLTRIGKASAISELFDLETAPTAPGQGALAIEARTEDVLRSDTMRPASEAGVTAPGWSLAAAITRGLAAIDDAEARVCSLAERQVLATLEAGCQAPVGAWARREGEHLVLTGAVYDTDGGNCVSETREIEWPERSGERKLGADVARALLTAGAAELAPDTLMRESNGATQ